jgi:hypothetical protein
MDAVNQSSREQSAPNATLPKNKRRGKSPSLATPVIGGLKDYAYLDSGADRTLISTVLHKRLEKKGIKFTPKQVFLTVATGETKPEDFYEARVPIQLQGRTYQINVFTPKRTRADLTLIGLDLMLPAGVIIRPAQLVWGFEDDPNTWHQMHQEKIRPETPGPEEIKIA